MCGIWGPFEDNPDLSKWRIKNPDRYEKQKQEEVGKR